VRELRCHAGESVEFLCGFVQRFAAERTAIASAAFGALVIASAGPLVIPFMRALIASIVI
jgi:hypothetical protein